MIAYEMRYVRGKYRDVILPMFVLRRLDALLEHSKDKVLADGLSRLSFILSQPPCE